MKPNTIVLGKLLRCRGLIANCTFAVTSGFYDDSIPKDTDTIVKTALQKTNPLIRHCIDRNSGCSCTLVSLMVHVLIIA